MRQSRMLRGPGPIVDEESGLRTTINKKAQQQEWKPWKQPESDPRYSRNVPKPIKKEKGQRKSKNEHRSNRPG